MFQEMTRAEKVVLGTLGLTLSVVLAALFWA